MREVQYIKCPWCGEDDFDLYGLKLHVAHCEKFAECDDPVREHTCVRGHRYRVTALEWRLYKGTLPMPCPICAREGRAHV